MPGQITQKIFLLGMRSWTIHNLLKFIGIGARRGEGVAEVQKLGEKFWQFRGKLPLHPLLGITYLWISLIISAYLFFMIIASAVSSVLKEIQTP